MNRNLFRSMLTTAAFLFILASCGVKPQEEKLDISYEKYVMPNGLQVILHEDHSDPVISYAIMYHVGSSREIPGRTGFAHLFEHLLFSGSENVKTGQFDRIIEGMGGSNNGFTNRDVTTYYEIFPKNALEKVLWLESDRMGFFINSITNRLMAIQQNVVQNEKRQSYDNSPYGFTGYVLDKNLYPASHPYNWQVIGEMEDLKNATLDDVKTYYEKFYGPNNATLVLAGDFNPDSVRTLVDKYFGEIKSHGEVQKRSAMVPVLEQTRKLYHEDNFANVPELNMVWPVVQQYHKDAYALDFLARLLTTGKKSPFYKVLVKEKKLTPGARAYNSPQELAGEFTLTVRANEGKTLKEIEAAVEEAFGRFEKDGITERDIERVKASMEKSFYDNISGIFSKSLELAFYNTFLDDPGYIEKDIENIKSVTIADVMRVYETYIKDRPFVATSFVPKGKVEMVADNSVPADVQEEDITRATQVGIAGNEEETIVKSPSALDRTIEPAAGPDPEVKTPVVWEAKLSNGIEVSGIKNRELPLVEMSLVIKGGVLQDEPGLPGVASMVAGVLPQGTKNRTPEELEEEIQLLGSTISMSAGMEEMVMYASALSRNFEKTAGLMKEMLLEPRWDSIEFSIAQTRTRNRIIQSEAQPRAVASMLFYRLLYGKENIFGFNTLGTRESIDRITLDDLEAYYDRNFSPGITSIHVAGNVTKEQVLAALQPLENEWKPKDVAVRSWPVPPVPEKSALYFYDIPGSRQSVIYIGYPAMSRDNPDFPKAEFINYRLGGAFTSILMQILREEKGFTYGASSRFAEMKSTAPFVASTMVRSDATLESLKIFIEEMNKYRSGITEGDLQFIKNCMIRSNATRFETNSALANMLMTMSKYGLPEDYIKKEEEIMKNMTLESHREMANRYIDPGKMYFVVVGDAATQLKEVEKAGLGKSVILNREMLID